MALGKGKPGPVPARGVEPRPVLEVLREVLHADNTVFHRSPTMRRGRYGHQGVVVQLLKARSDTGLLSDTGNV